MRFTGRLGVSRFDGAWACARGGRALCVLAALAAVVVPMGLASSALAASGEPPTIEGGQVKEVSEHDATLEVWIDPHGNETSYTVWLECQSEHEPLLPCEPVANAQLVQGTIPAGLEGVQTIDIELTGLTPGFDYWYAIRAVGAGRLVETTQNLFRIEKHSEAEIPSWYIKLSEEESAKTVKEYEAKHAKELEAQHAKEAEQQRAGEATKASEAAALKHRREEEAAMTGGVSLAATNVTVQSDGMALVKLECLGIESCHGKLTLTAKDAYAKVKIKGTKRPVRTVAIGTVDFSIAGDEAKAIEFKLNTAGHALLKADHGRCNASLRLLEFAPSPENTQTKAVQLIQQKTAKRRNP